MRCSPLAFGWKVVKWKVGKLGKDSQIHFKSYSAARIWYFLPRISKIATIQNRHSYFVSATSYLTIVNLLLPELDLAQIPAASNSRQP